MPDPDLFPSPISQAIYSHSFDPVGSQLVVTGGPLLVCSHLFLNCFTSNPVYSSLFSLELKVCFCYVVNSVGLFLILFVQDAMQPYGNMYFMYLCILANNFI